MDSGCSDERCVTMTLFSFFFFQKKKREEKTKAIMSPSAVFWCAEMAQSVEYFPIQIQDGHDSSLDGALSLDQKSEYYSK